MTKNSAPGRGENADYQDQMFGQGQHSAPTRKPLERRSASPDKYATSGIERAMGAHADQVHKVKS